MSEYLLALIDMHAKCGNMEKAFRIFNEIPRPDVFSYSALIMVLLLTDMACKHLRFFIECKRRILNRTTLHLSGVLTACSHTGLVEDGLRFWESMVKDYRIDPDADHYACMVDILGRAGKLDEAHNWSRSVAEQLFELEPENTGNYMLLSSIYALGERWDEAARVRTAMKERGLISYLDAVGLRSIATVLDFE
ncbi:hypothetical protein HHK36_032358 [Tetracentron sinense]|uniref:Pentatricopeptide repeat-containing protein n=1 Tax=Tetracentron sinense TaxID=13715 RepID=A0A834Y998_TETSI|nr:hypothetical protein HHK36_032358 [Tetracentron sinense]